MEVATIVATTAVVTVGTVQTVAVAYGAVVTEELPGIPNKKPAGLFSCRLFC
jgi:hypothetical protein